MREAGAGKYGKREYGKLIPPSGPTTPSSPVATTPTRSTGYVI